MNNTIKLLFILSTLLGMTLPSNGTGRITMTTDRAIGSSIEINVKAEGDVTITGTQQPGKAGYGYYTLTSQTITIEGDITFFASNYNELTSIDISECPDLEGLQIQGNSLKTLDLSHTPLLKQVRCGENQLTELTVGNQPQLDELSCESNNLAQIDISQAPALKTIWIYKNPGITNLDVSTCPELVELCCDDMSLSRLDISKNSKLTKLICSGNQISTLDISACDKLTYLGCSNCDLREIDLSRNSLIENLLVYGNKLTSLDVSNLTRLTQLACFNNQIGAQSMHDIVSSLPTWDSHKSAMLIVTTENPETEKNDCSKATVKLANEKGWEVYSYRDGDYILYEGSGNEPDEPASPYHIILNTDKPIGSKLLINYQTLSSEITFEGAIPEQIDNTTIELTLTAQKVIINGSFLAFAAQKQELTEVELNQPQIVTLWLDDNKLTDIDLSNEKSLCVLNVGNNMLTELNVGFLTHLDDLRCYGNKLTHLDVTWNSSLKQLRCADNQLRQIDLSHNKALVYAELYNNLINKSRALEFFSILPNFTDDGSGWERGVIILVNSHSETEGNSAYKSEIKTAAAKGFDVFDLNSDTDDASNRIPYEGVENHGNPTGKLWRLYVGGVQVGDVNAHDILDDGGSAVYDHELKQLTLTNADYTANLGRSGIANSEIDDLKIVLVGDNTARSLNNSPAFGMSHPTTITGSGTLTLDSEKSAGLYLNKSQLVIDNCNVTVKGRIGVTGADGNSDEKLTLKNATFKAIGELGSVILLSDMTLEECEFTSPAGASFNYSERAVVDETGNYVKGELVVKPVSTGLTEHASDKSEAEPTAIYDTTGRMRPGLCKGINIVVCSDGSTRKIVIP